MIVKDLPWDSYIISETDINGKITYANKAFSEACEYDITGLIGCNHNIVRAHDMPKWAFKDIWVNLKNGGEWKGIIKNQTFDGLKVYWVQAHIFPIYDGCSNIIGYRSERTPATDLEISDAMNKYDIEFD